MLLTDRSERWASRKASTALLFQAAVDARQEDRSVALDRVVVEHLELADALARRYSRPGSEHEFDDLRQVARLGLIKASRRYEAAKGDDFVSFAVPTISGEIKRYLRDCGWVVRPPRSVQELWARANRAAPSLAQTLGRTPSVADLSAALGESESDVDQALAAYSSLRPSSLDGPVGSDDALTLGETIGYTDARLDRIDVMQGLQVVLAKLPERERLILHLRFFDEKTQAEIAKEVGITQMHVSRLLAKTLQRLREALAGPDAAVPLRAAEGQAARAAA